MANPTSSLRERKKQRTSQTIARTSLDLVMTHGFDAVRVEDICEAAEVSRSTFFRHFDSKESAYIVGFQEGRLEAVLASLNGRPDDEGPLTAIRNAIFEQLEQWRTLSERVLLDAQLRRSTPTVANRANAELRRWEVEIANAVQKRVLPARNRPLTARFVAAIAVTAVNIANEQWVNSGATTSPLPIFRRTFAAAADLLKEEWN